MVNGCTQRNFYSIVGRAKPECKHRRGSADLFQGGKGLLHLLTGADADAQAVAEERVAQVAHENLAVEQPLVDPLAVTVGGSGKDEVGLGGDHLVAYLLEPFGKPRTG